MSEEHLTVKKLKEILADKPDDMEISIGWKGTIAPAYHCLHWEQKEAPNPLIIIHRMTGDMFE